MLPPFVLVKPFVMRTTNGRPYGYGGNRLFHRNRGVTQKSSVGEGVTLPFILVKSFVCGQSRTPVPTVVLFIQPLTVKFVCVVCSRVVEV